MRTRSRVHAVLAAGLLLGLGPGVGQSQDKPAIGSSDPLRLQVGPSREIKTLAEAALQVTGPTSIDVDAGSYVGDVVVWDGVDVSLRAVGGRVQLKANGAAAEGKGIWVVRRSTLRVDGFDFIGARVPSANGAGIRFESGHLMVTNCAFAGNENGILTGNDGKAVLEVDDSEFGYNGHGDGLSHNLYAGSIASLRVQGSWFHHANQGHLVKSRAAYNRVLYNRLVDGGGGKASYELEFPSGGVAIVVGNVIQQAAGTGNPHMVSFGIEGYNWPDNALYLVNNTLVDDRPAGGVALRVKPGAGTVKVSNNLLVGGASEWPPASATEGSHNFRAVVADFTAIDAERFHLSRQSRLVGRAVEPGAVRGFDLRPTLVFSHPRGTQARRDRRLSPGAFGPAVALAADTQRK